MNRRNASLLGLGLVLGACDQQEQHLTFDAAGATVTQTVPATGGTISTSAGASVAFPQGALTQATAITLTAGAQPASTASGTPVGTSSFRLTPEGAELHKPAEVTLRIGGNPADAWLASVLNTTPSAAQEIGAADVDLSAGLLRARVSTLGTLTAIVPEKAAVVQAEPLASAQRTTDLATRSAGASSFAATRSLEGRCGEAGNRCAIRVQASESLHQLAQGIAVVFPSIRGRIDIAGARASGKIALTGAFRTRLGKAGNGARIDVVVEPTPSTLVTETATEVVLTDVRVTASGAGMEGAQNVTLRFRHNGGREAWFEVTRSDIRVNDQSHTVRVVLPLARG